MPYAKGVRKDRPTLKPYCRGARASLLQVVDNPRAQSVALAEFNAGKLVCSSRVSKASKLKTWDMAAARLGIRMGSFSAEIVHAVMAALVRAGYR